MEELNLKDLFNYFIKKIPIMIIIVLLVLVLGSGYLFFIRKPLYKGETTVILVQQNTQVTQGDLTLSRNLVSTYSWIIKSKKVVNEAIDKLQLDKTYEDIANSISVTSEDNTEIIKITVNNENARLATNLANTIAAAFKKEIVNIYDLQNVYIFETAEVEESPFNIHIVRDLTICGLVGIVISFLIIFVVYYFDTSIKSSEELEEKLKITVLGNIPLYKRRKSV